MSPAERKAFAATIKPAVRGQSDKYSWRMYQRALKNGRERVYLMAWNSIYGYRPPAVEVLKTGFILANSVAIGEMDQDGDGFAGKTIQEICQYRSATFDWSFGAGHHVSEWIDITDWFWREYQRRGRCLFFKGVHDWAQINRNSRKCKHCGLLQRRTIKTIKTIERKEVWA